MIMTICPSNHMKKVCLINNEFLCDYMERAVANIPWSDQ